MYDLKVDGSTFKLINDHSKILVAASTSLDAWNKSGYAENFRIINSETMDILNRFWTYYSWDINATSLIVDGYSTSIKNVYSQYYSPTATSGTTTLSAEIHFKAAQRFWEKGTVNPITTSRPYCNVLFLYCDAMKCHFPIHHETSPLAGFHCTISLSNLTHDSPLFQVKKGNQLDWAIQTARMEFESWCAAFRELASNKSTTATSNRALRIRFCIGDAIAFCTVLNERRLNKDPLRDTYTRPGGSQVLCLDSRDYSKNGDLAPTTFNVIETSHLIDRVGLLNIFPGAIPLMKYASAVLYTSTRFQSATGAPSLLATLVNGDISIVCTFLGIVPTAYVTGQSMQASQPYHSHPSAFPRTNRIVWRLPIYGDTEMNATCAKPVCDTEDFATFLYFIYGPMLSNLYNHDPNAIHGQPFYTPKSFAALFAFLRGRVPTADWAKSLDFVMNYTRNQRAMTKLGLESIFDEAVQATLLLAAPQGPPPSYFPTYPNGVLKLERPPNPCALVITVPRSKLRPIFGKFMSHGRHLPTSFQIYCDMGILSNTFLSVQSVFGTLTTSADGNTGMIEKDENGWTGNSDLHVCGYFPALSFLRFTKDVVKYGLGVRFAPGKDVEVVFQSLLGPSLSIYRTSLQQNEGLHFFESLPGLQPPSIIPPTIVAPKPVAYSDNTFTVSFPRIDLPECAFFTKVTFTGDAIVALQNKAIVELSQTSPCTLTVQFDKFKNQVSFPFPVDYGTSKVRLSRAQGWIEVKAAFLTASNHGYFKSNHFPVTRGHDSKLYSFLPHINFRRLPQLDFSRAITPSIPDHLMSMFSQAQESIATGGFMAKVKHMIRRILLGPSMASSNKGHVIRLAPLDDKDMPILLFVKGVYLDYNSESLVGEAYVLPVTPDNTSAQSLHPKLDADNDTMKWWRSVLPAMVEQCRDWQHSTNCEYRTEGIPRKGLVSICSCGEQPLGNEVAAAVAGMEAIPKVTRIAISPFFPVSFLETVPVPAARVHTSSVPTGQVEGLQLDGMSSCKMCGKKNAKKCGKCMRVAYCSRECQVNDWKEHKKVCIAKGG